MNTIDDSAALPENTVVLNKEQIKLANISTGKIRKMLMGKTVECNGTVESHPNSVAVINAPMGGYIRSVSYIPGNYVAKGTVIAVLEHPDYIRLQQEFLETKNKLELYQEEFKRQGELTVENASSIKKMQQAQADYRITEVHYLSLKAQLKLIGINADSLYTDGIKTSIRIRAPISGTISRVNASIGKYSGPDDMIYEIVNTNDLHLHLKIFEKDMTMIKKGLHVNFWSMGVPGQKYNATINTIGQKLDEASNTFDIHARIQSGRDQLKTGMHVYAEIFLSRDSVYALPIEALVTSGDSRFAFLSDDSLFTRFEVKSGIQQSDFVELIDLPDSLTKRDMVISGAYYLNAEMQAEQ
ncbi:MAG: efflux RND transporter periplasmic adaptor subunit [Bacteroidales bacterium]|nr:efflux RND transporter periplasmic adaptor subunit [Bacteroidales bacterium]